MTAKREGDYRPAVSAGYEKQRERYVERVVCFLADCHAAEPAARSLPLSDVRAFLHMSSASAFLLPVIARLRERELVELAEGAGGERMLYLTETFIELAEEK